MMGAEAVDYHREAVLERGEDHPGAALAYYASRGETPAAWGGTGAARLGLAGTVTTAQYDAVFGVGGAVDPTTGAGLVTATRPGVELVVAAHKSVALLGVIGRAEDMHSILDAESDATVLFLDAWMRERGGRRGRDQRRTATSGLVWARTRHATSRAGDPSPHDHVLVANLVEMRDDAGGWKALDTAALRDQLHAATAAGRVAGARRAVELGYGVEPDDGPSGKLGHWRIAGVPVRACELFSKRSAQIDEAMEAVVYDSPNARGVAARETRNAKRHTPVGELMPGWLFELDAAGLPARDLLASILAAAAERQPVAATLTPAEVDRIVADVLDPDGPLATRKVFTRAEVTIAVGPHLFGVYPAELTRVVDRALADGETLPLIGVAGTRDRAFTLASVIARESAIADVVAAGCEHTTAPTVAAERAERAIGAKQMEIGYPLTAGQRQAITGICTSKRSVELVLGVAGAGKTTALDAVRAAFQADGYRVIGTSVSGQAARTLGREAHLDTSRTLASLLWRIDHDRLNLDDRTLVLLDEAGMTDDPALLRLLTAAQIAGAKLVMVGDDRQLGAIGPGGALRALLDRHHDAVHRLTDNVRQRNHTERAALAELRDGDIARAVDWYASNGRIAIAPTRDQALDAAVAAWAADTTASQDTTMLAWRRANVADLNRRARTSMAATGRLAGPELTAPGGAGYRAGDRIVTLAPGAGGKVVTSERGTVSSVDTNAGTLIATMDDGRTQRFGPDETGADRLAHGYAVTVHRSQGSTVDTAHRLEDGGGRELAYVAMSRARQRTTAYVVADNLDQAIEDLRRDWSSERRRSWAIDTGTPTTDALAIEADAGTPPAIRSALRRARLEAERAAVLAAIPIDPTFDLRRVERRLAEAGQDRSDLARGDGKWTGTPVGIAARKLSEAEGRRSQAEQFARDRLMSRRMRRTWRHDATAWADRAARAEAAFDRLAGPEITRLDATTHSLELAVNSLRVARDTRRGWLTAHPEAELRLSHLDGELRQIAVEERLAPQLRQAVSQREMEQSAYGQAPTIEAVDRGIDLGL